MWEDEAEDRSAECSNHSRGTTIARAHEIPNRSIEVTAIDTSQLIVDLYESLKMQTSLLKPLLKIVGNSQGCINLRNIEEFGKTVEQLILEGKLGYGILIGKKILL